MPLPNYLSNSPAKDWIGIMKCPACDGEMDFQYCEGVDEFWRCSECGEWEKR